MDFREVEPPNGRERHRYGRVGHDPAMLSDEPVKLEAHLSEGIVYPLIECCLHPRPPFPKRGMVGSEIFDQGNKLGVRACAGFHYQDFARAGWRDGSS